MVRVIVISDAPLFGQGLAQMLEEDGRLEVVSFVAARGEALNRGLELGPEAALVDMAMAGALETIELLSTLGDELKIIALGLTGRENEVVPCAEVGIAGYLCRDESLDELIATVESAVRGELRCSRRVAGALLRRVAALARRRSQGGPPAPLTPREVEIASLLDEGLTNKEIARRLGIEVGTVKNHVHHVLEKLDAGTRGEAAAKARELRLIRRHRLGSLLPSLS